TGVELRTAIDSHFNTRGRPASGRANNTHANRPRRVTRIGSYERSKPVALSRISRTELIFMWSPWWLFIIVSHAPPGRDFVTVCVDLTGHFRHLRVRGRTSKERCRTRFEPTTSLRPAHLRPVLRPLP